MRGWRFADHPGWRQFARLIPNLESFTATE